MPERKPNRLIYEASTYLQHHAHNPVDWYPWGPEALQKARDENTPIFLSIGYSACHWWHAVNEHSNPIHSMKACPIDRKRYVRHPTRTKALARVAPELLPDGVGKKRSLRLVPKCNPATFEIVRTKLQGHSVTWNDPNEVLAKLTPDVRKHFGPVNQPHQEEAVRPGLHHFPFNLNHISVRQSDSSIQRSHG